MNLQETIAWIEQTISGIDQARESLYKSQEALTKSHSGWDRRDARITAFSNCLYVLNTTKLGWVYVKDSLTTHWFDDWWKRNVYDSEPELPFVGVRYISQFGGFLKLGLVQFVFAAIENSFRSILRAIDSKKALGGRDNFTNVYNCLLALLGLQKWEPLLHLLRNFRNTIHNNGVFLYQSKQDDPVLYDGTQYEFKDGAKVEVSWELLIKLVGDVEKMLLEIVNHPKVVAISSIDDLSA